ncbi:uncharacterized protein RAG0_12942 [Rhynchosporium agropyri]|uniref:PLD phosphodiesterase domain-containing protein n=1 Tax=Rhynchosporium agropyri TaxID=914238 RepID=A0A1E1LAJ3_9HELO|nr:uncharacterized protein RAG0_12942 [Rhynchosporium agropyri]
MDDASTVSGSTSPSPKQLQEDRDLQEAIRLSNIHDSSTASASLSSSPEQHQEDRDLQGAIIISKIGGSSTASGTPSALGSPAISLSPSPATERVEKSERGSKRKAQDEIAPKSKLAPSLSTSLAVFTSSLESMDESSSEQVPSSLSSPSIAVATVKYPNGTLRITRTPGRKNAKNCVNLKDVIQGKSLVSACAFSFFIGENEFYDHFPLSHSSNAVPVSLSSPVSVDNVLTFAQIYIGRDVNMDPMTQEACRQAGVPLLMQDGKPGKVAKKIMKIIEPKLREIYTKRLGKNYNAFYAWSSGSSQSKILVLVDPEFLRLVITSCNMMNIDTVLGDNHWYIHDFPKRTLRTKADLTPFETDLLSHLTALGTPECFVDSIQGLYDYSTVKVHLTTSVPGVCSGDKAENHGLLRLRRIILGLDLKLSEKVSKNVRLEICAASIGNISAKWLNGFNDCVMGRAALVAGDDLRPVPDLKLFYPTVGDVKTADSSSQDAASNIGCHLRPWIDAPNAVKRIFHHYRSKDTGKLFHQKLILAYNPQDTNAAPYFVYIGSANFSQSAWGALEADKKKNEATGDTKLVKLTNFECGVVVPGHLVESLLEKGTKSWQDGIVPYDQAVASYTLPKDRPWNDPRWVVDFDKNYQGAS